MICAKAVSGNAANVQLGFISLLSRIIKHKTSMPWTAEVVVVVVFYVVIVDKLKLTGRQNSPVLDDQRMSEDNPKLRLGCPPDYQSFVGNNIDLKIFISSVSPRSHPQPFHFP